MKKPSKYTEAVRYIEGFSNVSLRKNLVAPDKKGKRDLSFFIERTKYMLKLLGNPEKGFSYVHITGTAGKGSVSHMMQASLVASGKKTGLFTSPYVTVPTEKIQVDDKYISAEDFVKLVEYIKPFVEKAKKGAYGAPSTFELFFILALLHFKRQKCEWVVLEVGLGGRYDATNVITNPKVTAITNIDYDHTEILGKTLREIAFDKAGIIKKGSSFFTSEQRLSIQKFFKDVCKKEGAEFHAIERQSHYSAYNRELVRAMGKSVGIFDEYIEEGITHNRLPSRFEKMQEGPTIILDGAHNRAKIRSTIANVRKLKYKKLYLILAIADMKKDHQAIIKPLAPLADSIMLTQVKSSERRSVYPELLVPLMKKFKKKSASLGVVLDPHEALKTAMKKTAKDDLILVTGSFFLAGELRKKWFSEEWVLKNQRSF